MRTSQARKAAQIVACVQVARAVQVNSDCARDGRETCATQRIWKSSLAHVLYEFNPFRCDACTNQHATSEMHHQACKQLQLEVVLTLSIADQLVFSFKTIAVFRVSVTETNKRTFIQRAFKSR